MNVLRFFFLLATVAFAGCRRTKEPSELPSARIEGDKIIFTTNGSQLSGIATEAARPATAKPIRLTGRVVWDEDVTVRIFTSFGGRVTRIVAPLGQSVEKDAALALIASPDFGQVQADAVHAALDLRLARQTLERLKDLTSYGAVAQKDLHAAEIDFMRAEGEADRVSRRLELYGGAAHSTNQEFALKSPLAGIVVEKNINPGQEVRPDQLTANAPPLFVVTDPTRLWVILDATEQALPILKPGATVIVRTPTYGDDSFPARIENVADAVDQNSRTIKVRAALQNPDRKLKAEMFVTAELAVETPHGVEVPSAAIFLKADKHFVFIQESADTYRKHEILVGDERDGWMLVREGLAVGEHVVRDGALMLDEIMSDQDSQ